MRRVRKAVFVVAVGPLFLVAVACVAGMAALGLVAIMAREAAGWLEVKLL